jgi:Holliday junction resolvasome RuvABC ATP-dependent DNA helicase subunit
VGLLDRLRRRRPEQVSSKAPPPMPAARPQPREWRPVKAPIRYEGSNFRMVEGLDDVKAALDLALRKQHETRVSGEDRRLHILLAGPPGVSKSLLLLEAEKEIPQERRVFVLGSQVSKAGLRNRLLSSPSSIDFVLIDELDKMGREDYDVLLSMMESGRISVLKAGLSADARVLATVLATANYLERIPVELLDRFLILYVESYDSQDFVRVATRLLRERGAMPPEEASALAAVLWNSGFRSVRDVVRVANAARGDPGKAYQLIEIMRARSPPSELVRSRGWRPRR